MVGRFCRVIDIFSRSAKLSIYVPKFHWGFKYYILHITGSYFSCGLVFNVQNMSIMLNLDNSVSGSLLEVPFSGLLVLEIYPISYFKRGLCPVHGFLGSFEAVLIQCLLGNGQCKSVCFKIQHLRIWVSQESLHGL